MLGSSPIFSRLIFRNGEGDWMGYEFPSTKVETQVGECTDLLRVICWI